MKRRLFLTGLFATAAIAAMADPTQARQRRIRPGGRLRTGGRRRQSGGRRQASGGRVRTVASRRRTDYQPTSYSSGASVTNQRPAPPPDLYARTRGSDGRLTEGNIQAFRAEFDQEQSREAMRKALGEPAEHTLNKDRWRIKRTDVYGRPAEDGWFTADYGLTGWNPDSKTVKAPEANW